MPELQSMYIIVHINSYLHDCNILRQLGSLAIWRGDWHCNCYTLRRKRQVKWKVGFWFVRLQTVATP